jgi:hypothetical protein
MRGERRGGKGESDKIHCTSHIFDLVFGKKFMDVSFLLPHRLSSGHRAMVMFVMKLVTSIFNLCRSYVEWEPHNSVLKKGCPPSVLLIITQDE